MAQSDIRLPLKRHVVIVMEQCMLHGVARDVIDFTCMQRNLI